MNKEGQTQEPVGGMPLFHNEDANVYIDRAIAMLKEEYEDNPFTAGYNGIVSLLGYAKESHIASIAPEGEDEEVKRIKNWIEQRMSLFPDDPNLSERGAYDGYLNVLNIINNKTTAPPSPELREEAQDLLIKIAPPETFGEDADCERIYNIIDELAKAASLPQSSTEEEKNLWEEVANVLYGFEMGRRFDMNELLSTYKITKR